MNLTLRLSTRLVALQNMTSMELAPSSESSDRPSIFIRGHGLQLETQILCDDFDPLLFFMLFWDGPPAGQIVDAKAFCAKAIPLLSAEYIARFDSLRSKPF